MHEIDEEMRQYIEAKDALEQITMDALSRSLHGLYLGLDEFSFTGTNRVPELCHWLSDRLVNRLDSHPDGTLLLRQLAAELKIATAIIDDEGTDVL